MMHLRTVTKRLPASAQLNVQGVPINLFGNLFGWLAPLLAGKQLYIQALNHTQGSLDPNNVDNAGLFGKL
ncbi:MAG: hypothetical protein HY706_12320 [Candidatus Hydrogenedentes bacterium]|nr:hypothetical protein [Candidatus Hydrogenedentota bacterium]